MIYHPGLCPRSDVSHSDQFLPACANRVHPQMSVEANTGSALKKPSAGNSKPEKNGAAAQDRTEDLILTKDALYH